MNQHQDGSWAARISNHLQPDDSVVIPPRIAAWLERNCKMTADRRSRLADTDPDAYVAFTALHLSAMRSGCGTKQAVAQRNTTQSQMWMSTKQAADTLNVTDRCIRNWCTNGRLDAVQVGARWLINPISMNHIK